MVLDFLAGPKNYRKDLHHVIMCQAQELRCDPAAIRPHRGAIQGWLQTRLARHTRDRRALEEAQ